MRWWNVSSDSHVVEPVEIFAPLEERFGSAAPHLVQRHGLTQWMAGEDRYLPVHFPDRAGDRFVPPSERPERGMESIRPGCSDPDEFLKDNEADGIWASVVFPSHCLGFYSLRGSELTSAMARVYNDWIVDFGSAHPDRIRTMVMLNVEDIEGSAAELERLHGLGAGGALIPVRPPQGEAYSKPDYDPIWAMAERLDVPLHLHIASDSNPAGLQNLSGLRVLYNADSHLREAISDLIFGGVFSRFPGLKMVSVEHEGSWVPYFLDRMDWHYANNLQFADMTRMHDGLRPSDIFRRHFFVSFIEDQYLFQSTAGVGMDHFMWGNDYPHSESSFPRSQPILEKILEGLSLEDRRLVTQKNACDLYRLPLPPDPSDPAGAEG